MENEMVMKLALKIIFILLLFTNIGFAASSPKKPEVKEEPVIQKKYSVILYSNNSIYKMNSDGTSRKKIAEKSDVLDMYPISNHRILIHSSQYEGESLEIFDPADNIWSLVEFTEGKIPMIAVSDDGVKIAYEVKHTPISTEGDGVWLYDTTGTKSHVKVSSSALTIESMSIFSGKLYILYHELNLISDEAGLFVETIWLTGGSGKPQRKKVTEGLRLLLPDGFSLGLAYPATGRQIEVKPIPDGKTFSILMPKGDIIFYAGGFSDGKDPVLIFDKRSVDFAGNESTETLSWKCYTSKTNPLIMNNLTGISGFRWSQDNWLYFNASYKDPSGELASPMLFRTNNLGKTFEIVSILGGPFIFQYE
jgi:hypothetical protein